MPLRPILIALALLVTAAPAAADEPVRAGSAGARAEARDTLAEARALFDGRGVDTGKELSPVLKDLAVRLKALPSSEQREARSILARPTSGQEQAGEQPYSSKAEEHRLCSAHFCIHWITRPDGGEDPDVPPLADGGGDGLPDYVQTMSQVFENVYSVENGAMGWREPKADGTHGGETDKVDVYIKQLGDQGIFGYATPDPGQSGNSQAAYLVMDNDFTQAEFPRYSNPVAPMQVTAAHEYNHVLQFGYDVLQDSWMFESTAVWMEDKVYDDINDYVSYLPAWVQLTQVPLTAFNPGDMTDPLNVKVYGDAVWNRWLDERYGADTIRAAWERSLDTRPPSFAPEAYEAALVARGTSFFDAFVRFAADTAEWRSSTGVFEEGTGWPDVQRATRTSLAPGGRGVSGRLDHTSFALVNVTPTDDQRIKLIGSLPRDTRGALALVGREGDPETGVPVVVMKQLPRGGQLSVEMANPGRFQRLTAVLVNGDARQAGFSQFLGDWEFAKDGQEVLAHVSADYTPPRVRKRSPSSGAKASPRTKVVVTFSEPMENVTSKTVGLVGPGGKRVSVRVTYDVAKRQARLVPKKPLGARKRYSVKIGSTVVDGGDNRLPAADRTWKFSTRSR
ncbi:MAG TPA: Ig-like domain-containing protein [Thermoleophilaceae bacterium]